MKDISEIIARYLLNIADKDELDDLSRWERKSADNSRFLGSLRTFWNHPSEEKSSGLLTHARERLLTRITPGVGKQGKRSLFSSFSKIAAAIILLISITGVSSYFISKSNLFYKNNWVEVSTQAGQQSKVTLPDSSIVWLNAETEVRYHPDRRERKVYLNGEAYFEVKHSSDYPFVVETGDAKVRVLGTKFNVSHYPGAEFDKVSLLSGRIEMSLAGRKSPIELKPGEKVVYRPVTHVMTKMKANVQNEILWRQGILIFDNDSFNELIQKLERYYAVTFVYNKEAFRNIHYTGTINNLTIERVLEFINLTIPVNYEIDNKTIRLALRK